MSQTLQHFINKAHDINYSLPGKDGDEYVIGTSGGADSSVTAILLTSIFPDTNFHLLFTDTQAEVKYTDESIEALECFIGKPIKRISVEGGLYGLVEHYSTKKEDDGFFLPSNLVRYCTRVAKLTPFEDYMDGIRENQLDECKVHNFTGIRADEPARSGFNSDMPWMQTHFPLRDLGLNREDVFKILTELHMVPRFYKWRGRSGCSGCFFQRGSEFIGTMMHDPEGFAKAQQYEKLSEIDAKRFVVQGGDLSGVKINYPIPASIDARTCHDFAMRAPVKLTRNDNSTLDLFSEEMTDVFVGVEYIVDPSMNLYGGSRTGSPGTTHMELINWCTTKAGMSTILNNHYWTRKDTAEVFFLTPSEFEAQYKMAVFHLEIPSHLIDLGKSTKGTYTWKRNHAMAQLKMVASAIKRTLHRLSIEENVKEYAPFVGTDTWEGEQYTAFKQLLKSIPEEGKILNTYKHTPSSKRPSAPTGDNAPCQICSK